VGLVFQAPRRGLDGFAVRSKATKKDPAKKDLAKCECGSPLPVHFLEFADERFSHVCRCERKYKVEGGAFVPDGFEVNPFARYDDAQAKVKKERARAK